MARALVVVAHPDDETIWCGGTILMHPDWEWVILSLCRKDDLDRAPKFRKACKALGASCAISNLEDEHPEKKLRSLGEVKRRIAAMLGQLNAGESFDFVFTHGANGEYGHNRHREVHRAVKEMIAGGRLRCRKIFFFSYKLSEGGESCEPDTRDAGVERALSREIAREKRLLITSVYEFISGSFEERSAQSIESFKVVDQ
jgi:hypothetical protein